MFDSKSLRSEYGTFKEKIRNLKKEKLVLLLAADNKLSIKLPLL